MKMHVFVTAAVCACLLLLGCGGGSGDGAPVAGTPENPIPPSSPVSFCAQDGDGLITLSWLPPASDGGLELTGYRIFRTRYSDTALQLYAEIGVEQLSFEDEFPNGYSYIYTIKAVNAVGESPAAAPVLGRATVHLVEPCMVAVVAGSFSMGALDTEPGGPEEYPCHQVNLSAYEIGKYEVTNAEFAEMLTEVRFDRQWTDRGDQASLGETSGVVTVNGQRILSVSDGTSGIEYASLPLPHYRPAVREGQHLGDHPASGVSWFGAILYCHWLDGIFWSDPCYDLETWQRISPVPNGYRLPTEAEWERAAAWESKHWIYGYRADTYDSLRCNCVLNNPLGWTSYPLPCTTPVGYYNGDNGTVNSPSPVGCYDMSGNVAEWCHDRYSATAYSFHSATDPVLDGDSTSLRVVRGGSWLDNQSFARTAARGNNLPYANGSGIYGFRVARNAN